MLPHQIQQLSATFRQAAAELIAARAATLAIDAPAVPPIELDRPKQAAHGDLASNLAMQLAKPLRMNPRQVADDLVVRVRGIDASAQGAGLIDALEIAGPGFINFRMRTDVLAAAATAQSRAARVIGVRVRGLSPERSRLSRTRKLPKEEILTLSPSASVCFITSKTASTRSAASFFEKPPTVA